VRTTDGEEVRYGLNSVAEAIQWLAAAVVFLAICTCQHQHVTVKMEQPKPNKEVRP